METNTHKGGYEVFVRGDFKLKIGQYCWEDLREVDVVISSPASGVNS